MISPSINRFQNLLVNINSSPTLQRHFPKVTQKVRSLLTQKKPDNMPCPPTAKELSKEINKRKIERIAELKKIGLAINDQKKPPKPRKFKTNYDGVKFKEHIGENKYLTCHHILPYKVLKSKFVEALINYDPQAMQGFMSYSGVFASIDPSEAFRFFSRRQPYTATTKQNQLSCSDEADCPPKGSVRIGGTHFEIKSLFYKLAWLNHNVFIGPCPEMRGDDAADKVDARMQPSGSMYDVSIIATEVYVKNFNKIDPNDMAITVRNLRYDPSFIEEEWVVYNNKFYQKGNDPLPASLWGRFRNVMPI